VRAVGAKARAAAAALGTLSVAACASSTYARLPDPASARRFEIVAVGDSTFDFLVGGARWVRTGVVGIAVDPRRRDALVARFVVQRRAGNRAVALVTGQTANVTPGHVALLSPAKRGVLAQRAFWVGLLAGGAAGAAAAHRW
jgi:hypothetical protein